MNKLKEICFISSPGNGLSCCCCQSEVRNPSPTWSGKWNEAADPNLNHTMSSKPYAGRGNGKYRKQQGGKHFDASKCKGWEKEEGEEIRGHGDACAARLLVSCPLVFRLDLILPAISQPILQRLQRVRCALRALMMPISLSYPFTVPPWARHRDSRGYFCIQC